MIELRNMAENRESHSLDDTPYSWKLVEDAVHIFWRGQRVTTLKKEKVEAFLTRISIASEKEAQLVMAKITGNFKRGNERSGRKKLD
ncbi:MAG: hypothetical protein ACFFED_10125 [Candidatus Thorarchaeota archaeon]